MLFIFKLLLSFFSFCLILEITLYDSKNTIRYCLYCRHYFFNIFYSFINYSKFHCNWSYFFPYIIYIFINVHFLFFHVSS